MNSIEWSECTWLNPPAAADTTEGSLVVTALAGSDFWRTTHYGFIHENGHFLGKPFDGDVSVEIAFDGDFAAQWDQAGLMVRRGPDEWIKAGVERVDGELLASVVVTHGTSDWSVTPLAGLDPHARIAVRASRRGDSVTISIEPSGQRKRMIRLAHFAAGGSVEIGPMCCSDAGNLHVRFASFLAGPADED